MEALERGINPVCALRGGENKEVLERGINPFCALGEKIKAPFFGEVLERGINPFCELGGRK